jgi:hypothetical protein
MTGNVHSEMYYMETYFSRDFTPPFPPKRVGSFPTNLLHTTVCTSDITMFALTRLVAQRPNAYAGFRGS